MSRKSERYVIFAGPQRRSGAGTKYIARDGSITKFQHEAARFSGPNEAIEFAKEPGIELDGATLYIGIEEFRTLNLVDNEDFL